MPDMLSAYVSASCCLFTPPLSLNLHSAPTLSDTTLDPPHTHTHFTASPEISSSPFCLLPSFFFTSHIFLCVLPSFPLSSLLPHNLLYFPSVSSSQHSVPNSSTNHCTTLFTANSDHTICSALATFLRQLFIRPLPSPMHSS